MHPRCHDSVSCVLILILCPCVSLLSVSPLSVFPFINSPVIFPPHSPHLFLIPSLVCVCVYLVLCSPCTPCQLVPSSVSLCSSLGDVLLQCPPSFSSCLPCGMFVIVGSGFLCFVLCVCWYFVFVPVTHFGFRVL